MTATVIDINTDGETGGWEVNLNSGGEESFTGDISELGLEKYPVMEKWIRISGTGNR